MLSSAIGSFVIGLSPIGSGGGLSTTTLLEKLIPSYLYWQYRDDDNLQAFVDAQNQLAQQFITWFCNLNLPIYTRDPVSGALLDWVGEGLYGLPRPVLGSGTVRPARGPYNTWQFDSIRFNARDQKGTNFIAETVTDDIYRRALTWHFFKGDEKVFNVRWLKRRIMRFLTGINGTDPGIDQTYLISVSFGVCCQVNITLKRFSVRVVRSARFNTFKFNTTQFNYVEISITSLGSPFALGTVLKEAIDQGVLELPFQFTYVVNVQ